jgi:hypothetical protein
MNIRRSKKKKRGGGGGQEDTFFYILNNNMWSFKTNDKQILNTIVYMYALSKDTR